LFKSKKSVSYKVKIGTVGSNWKIATYDKDSDCQWLMYNNVPLKDGDEAILTITKIGSADDIINRALVRAGRAIRKANALRKENL